MTQYKLSVDTIIYPDLERKKFVLTNIRTKEDFLLTSYLLISILDQLANKWQTIEEIHEIFQNSNLDLSFDEINEFIQNLIKEQILVEQSKKFELIENQKLKWEKYNWLEAYNFYVYVFDYPFIDYQEQESANLDSEFMKQYSQVEEMPSPYKIYPNTQVIKLPSISNSEYIGSFKNILNKNYFDRNDKVSKKILDLTTLSKILYFSFGEIGEFKFPYQGKLIKKTSPSGGARHPTEAYLLIKNILEIEDGIYHYSVKDHSLELNKKLIENLNFNEIVYELQDGVSFEPSVIIFLSSVLERSMWRYREPRTFIPILSDIGHLMETIRMVCLGLEVKIYIGHGFEDDILEKYLGLDVFEEPVLKFAALG